MEGERVSLSDPCCYINMNFVPIVHYFFICLSKQDF